MMRRAPTIILSCAALLVAGCGYRPLYGASSAAPAGVSAELSQVAVPEASDRTGQLIRNSLLPALGDGSGGERYTLRLATTLRKPAIIEQPQPAVTRQAVHLAVNYELVDRSSGATVHSGKTFSQVSFDVVRQPFADMQAETNATERAAREVAGDIRTRIAAFLASRPAP